MGFNCIIYISSSNRYISYWKCCCKTNYSSIKPVRSWKTSIRKTKVSENFGYYFKQDYIFVVQLTEYFFNLFELYYLCWGNAFLSKKVKFWLRIIRNNRNPTLVAGMSSFTQLNIALTWTSDAILCVGCGYMFCLKKSSPIKYCDKILEVFSVETILLFFLKFGH